MSLFRKQPAKMDDPELIEALRGFVGAFEVLFHHDWDYAKTMIGDEEEGGTFLKPGLKDETEDWGARGELLEKYRTLKSLMDARGMTSDINPNIERALKEYGQWKA
jgi:hypothetical protein